MAGYGHHGREQLVHAAQEYYSFIALVGGLYVVSGGVLIDIRGQGRPWSNTATLAMGALAANLVGTTGASVLLIRPFIRFNRGRLRPMHVVFFIFIVSNCGGCVTPIGDPPLYLGYLKGVPFAWTISRLLPNWLVTVHRFTRWGLPLGRAGSWHHGHHDRRVPVTPRSTSSDSPRK